jgi:hypothetical protein
VVEGLLGKLEALSSNPTPTKKKKKKNNSKNRQYPKEILGF